MNQLLEFTFSGLLNKVTDSPKKCEPNTKINLDSLVRIIKSEPPCDFTKVRELTANSVQDGLQWTEIKTATKPFKEALPWFIFSGWCQTHHNNKNLSYNGCIQVDIDFKHTGGNQRAEIVKTQIKNLPFTTLAAISPSGFGVKALVKTTNENIEYHKEAATQVIKAISKALDIEVNYFDSLGASQPCFVPYDKEAYYNPGATIFEVHEQSGNLTDFESVAVNINESDAIKFAERFAEQNGYPLLEGSKHMHLTYFSIAANLLGLEENEVWGYAENKRIKVESNCISYPYETYRNSFGTWNWRLKQNKRNDNRVVIHGQPGQKLSDILNPVDIIGKSVVAPTGSGKTFLVAQYPGRKVIVCPTIALVQNVCKEYEAHQIGGEHTKKIDFEAAKDMDFIACTYASFRKLSTFLWEYKDDISIFIDEAHNFSASTSKAFQLKQLSEVLQLAKDFKSITTLTGTEIFNAHPFIEALPVIEARIGRPQKECYFVDGRDTIFTTAEAVKRSISKGRFPIVLFDNTGENLSTLKSYLSDIDGLRYFNSHKKQDSDFQQITQTGKIRDGVTGIITTSVLKEGNNIYNEKDFDIIILGSFHSATIEQISNRPRRAKSIQITVIRSSKRQTSDRWFNPSKYADFIKRNALEACKELNTKDALCDNEILYQEFKARQSIQTLPIQLNEDDETPQYKVDYLLLSNFVFIKQQMIENRNDELMKRNLSKYGIKVFDQVQELKIEANQLQRTAAAVCREQQKTKELEQYNMELDNLANDTMPAEYCDRMLKLYSKTLSKAQKKALKWFSTLYGITFNTDETIKELRQIEGKQARFVLLLKRLRIAQLENNSDYMQTNRKFVLVMKAIRATFKDGEILESEQIKERLINCLSLDKSFNTEIFEQEERNTKVLRALRVFFEVKRILIKRGDPIRMYSVSNLSFDNILLNLTKLRLPEPAENYFDEVGQPVFSD